jgi:hypothetical protein
MACFLRGLLYIIMWQMLHAPWVIAQDTELTNYKSGISLTFSGAKGTAYMEEYLYHDKLVSDRKIIYIRDTTHIFMAHNDYNNLAIANFSNSFFYIIGKNGMDSLPGTGDEGIIRYKVDRDLQVAGNWAGTNNPGGHFPAYTTPLSFAGLEYEPGVPVVGTTGSNGQPLSDKVNQYWRGHIDPYGDEWHTIAVADDDSSIVAPTQSKVVYWSSDGKEFIFVVNPKTPALTIRASGNAEFYTTPPKAHLVPKIHMQTTYFNAHTGSVTFELKDLYGHNVFYRINHGTWVEDAHPVLDQDDFTDGTNTLEYYYAGNQSYTKTRTVVKNPSHPSLPEAHGNFLWKDQNEFNRIRARLTRAPYAGGWQKIKTNASCHYQAVWDVTGHTPHRRIFIIPDPWYSYHPAVMDASLPNAFVALVEGWDYTRSGATKSFGRYAVEMLLGNSWARVDHIGWEYDHSQSPHPSSEVITAGYYFTPAITDAVAAYDIVAAHFRSDQVSGGLTAIEDDYVRDQFGRYALACMQYHMGPVGMWDTAQDMGAMMVGMCLREYTSPVYGTSGYGTVQTAYLFTPYLHQAFTWKQIYSDRNVPLMAYPDCVTQRDPETDVLWLPGGQWGGSNLGYADNMQATFNLLLNMTELHCPDSFPEIRAGIINAINGELIGIGAAATTPMFQAHPMMGNAKFPDIGPLVRPSLVSRNIEASELADGNVFELVWYDDSLNSLLGGIPNGKTPSTFTPPVIQWSNGTLAVVHPHAPAYQVTVFNVVGQIMAGPAAVTRIWTGTWPAGIYTVKLNKGAENLCKKAFVLRR